MHSEYFGHKRTEHIVGRANKCAFISCGALYKLSPQLKPIQPTLRLKHLPPIKVIHQHRRRRFPPHPRAPPRLLAYTPLPPPCIGIARVPPIRHLHPQNLGVEEMVHDVHPLPHRVRVRRRPCQGGRTVELALRKGRVERVEGCFPEVGEFVEEVGELMLVGAVVEESDEAGIVRDELAEGGPGVEGPFVVVRVAVRDVRVGNDTALAERPVELGDVEVVSVCEQDSDDFVRVLVEPVSDYLEVVL